MSGNSWVSSLGFKPGNGWAFSQWGITGSRCWSRTNVCRGINWLERCDFRVDYIVLCCFWNNKQLHDIGTSTKDQYLVWNMIQRDFDGNVRVGVKRNVVWAALTSQPSFLDKFHQRRWPLPWSVKWFSLLLQIPLLSPSNFILIYIFIDLRWGRSEDVTNYQPLLHVTTSLSPSPLSHLLPRWTSSTPRCHCQKMWCSWANAATLKRHKLRLHSRLNSHGEETYLEVILLQVLEVSSRHWCHWRPKTKSFFVGIFGLIIGF